MKKPQVVGQIKKAKREITMAEEDLTKVIAAIKVLSRAEKVTAGKVVADAFETLKVAKEKLSLLEKLVRAAKTPAA